MVKNKRIVGGEKTKKTGEIWSKEELEKVLKLYLLIEGKGIHETNPKIHDLATRLKRSTRSVEAQLLIYRYLDRKENYSRGNMNKICKELWHNSQEKHAMKNLSEDLLFPNAFFSWSGARDGVVKKPFDDSEKRLIEHIETTLVRRLYNWAKDIASNKSDTPRAVFLVGGPGNGKTDAVEEAIKYIESFTGAIEMTSHFFGSFNECNDRGMLPRKVTYNEPVGKYNGLVLVQDASVPDQELPQKSTQELLLDDLESIVLNPESNIIYICCVNRGILAQCFTVAEAKKYKLNTISFLNHISLAVTSCNEPIDAWPLKDFPRVAVWPMDVESLVDISFYKDSEAPGKTIIKYISEAKNWKCHEGCSAKDHCPFACNQTLLSVSTVQNSLLDLLHSYELATGKRWNFRELFALMNILMIGSEKDFNGKKPCDWSREQYGIANQTDDSTNAFKASFRLVSKLYFHSLFPRWPKLGRLRYDFLNKLKTSGNSFLGSREKLHGFFDSLKTLVPNKSSMVGDLINGPIGELLDPVEYSGPCFIDEERTITIETVENSFSHSIKLGLEKVENFLVGSEKLLMQYLIDIEKYIEEAGDFNKNDSKTAKSIHAALKIFASRLFKRNIGVRLGIYKNIYELKLYKSILSDNVELHKTTSEFEKMLNNHAGFQASLITTFGQPEPSNKRNAILQTPRVSVDINPIPDAESRPKALLPYFKVQNKSIPLTFELFFALHKSANGQAPASLPREIFSLLDSIKSCIVGEMVRDPNQIKNYEIILSNIEDKIKYNKQRMFYLEKKDN